MICESSEPRIGGKPPDLSILSSCYNEAGFIERFITEVRRILEITSFSFEIIIVDDGSEDESVATLRSCAKQYPFFGYHVLDHNRGRGRAITEGLCRARGEVIGFLDLDLELPPIYILPLTVHLREEYDVATVRRFYNYNIFSVHRVVLTEGYKLLIRSLFRTKLTDTESGCKFFRRDRILPILTMVRDERWFWDTEIMLRAERAGLRIVEMPILYIRDQTKATTVKFIRDIIRYLQAIVRFHREFR